MIMGRCQQKQLNGVLLCLFDDDVVRLRDCRIAPRHALVRGVPTRRSFHWRAVAHALLWWLTRCFFRYMRDVLI